MDMNDAQQTKKTPRLGKYRVVQFGPLGPKTIGFYETKKEAEYARRIAGDAVVMKA